MFTKTEVKIIKDCITLQGIADKMAKKFGSCSRNYVSQILNSKKPPKTKKAIAIDNEFRKLLAVLNEDDE